jgi:HAD superfamily hydrolase (TIGR01490 family)
MSLALFDLDNTLIAGDSTQSFSEFLASSEIVTPPDFLEKNHAFMADYDEGQLDLAAYMRYTLSPLTGLTPPQTQALISRFLDDVLPTMLLPKAQALLNKHREAGDTLVIISATGSHLVHPISERLCVDHAIAVDVEINEGQITGEIEGVPAFREGKVTRVKEWASQQGFDYQQAVFYSDSRNDLPLLEAVIKPIAVNPDPALEQVAKDKGWEILSLR